MAPLTSTSQGGGFFGQASKLMGSVFGGGKKVKQEPIQSLQLAAAAAKKVTRLLLLLRSWH
jgi:hypothetical protein